jgi:SSS family solute:Na+ symporter
MAGPYSEEPWAVRLSWPDYVVLACYFAMMIGLGVYGTRRKRSDEEYFLVGRRMPWLAVGISVVASMISSITYLAEPGEVWKSGVTHATGKLLGIPLEMLFVWGCCIPFMMRFHFTSVYEYLEHRFGRPTRRFGAFLFVAMVVLWMGFVVLVLSQVVQQLCGMPLFVVVFTVGAVTTLYTMLGGLRMVIWADVVQVAILVAGAAGTVGYIMWTTGGTPFEWVAAAEAHLLANGQPTAIPIFSWDPTVRATVVSVAINMAVWHVCMHSSSQITVQRYFSTRDVRAARRSFLASSVVYVGVSLLLLSVGLAVLHYYVSTGRPIDGTLDPETQRDLIFPTFAMHHLPVGAGGALLAALLSAAMSTVDAGLGSLATVVSLELRPSEEDRGELAHQHTANSKASRGEPGASHVRLAMVITALAGAVITGTAFVLTFMPPHWGIFGAIPRTFNAITGPLGGLFLIGIFLSCVRQRSAVVATACGLLVSIVMGYLHQISTVLQAWGIVERTWPDISFAWILPCSFLATILVAPLLSLVDSSSQKNLAGLTWWTRHESTVFATTMDRARAEEDVRASGRGC